MFPLGGSPTAKTWKMTRGHGPWYFGKNRCRNIIDYLDVRSYKSEMVVTITHPRDGIVGVAILDGIRSRYSQ